MTQGLQVFDASGNIVVDTTHYLGRILGVTTVGISNGSITNANFSKGTPFWVANRDSGSYNTSQPIYTLTNSTTISWSWGAQSGNPGNTTQTLIYGVY
jgi:hypothetical protein